MEKRKTKSPKQIIFEMYFNHYVYYKHGNIPITSYFFSIMFLVYNMYMIQLQLFYH